MKLNRIQNCFKNAGFITDASNITDAAEEGSDPVDGDDWEKICEDLAENAYSFQNYLNFAEDVITNNVRSNDDIIGDIKSMPRKKYILMKLPTARFNSAS